MTSIPPLLGACLLTAVTAFGGPLQRADVINEPLWVLHLDAAALRQTTLGQFFLTELEKPEARKKLAAFHTIFNFDLRQALHGLTLYSATKAEEDGVLLVYADFDAARLTTLAEGAKEHQSSAHGRHVIHSWLDEKKQAKAGGKPRTYAAIHGQTVIFAQKESRLAEALDVLDRTKPNLATNLEFTKLGNGTAFLQGTARKMDLPAFTPNAAVFRQSKLMMLTVGETQRKLQAALTLETEKEEVAQQIESIARGLIGLLALQQDKPQALKLARALAIEQSGAAVTARMAMSADEAVELLKAGAALRAARK